MEGNSSQFQNNRTVTINGGSLTSTNHTIGTLLNGGGFLVVNGGGTMTTSANVTLGDVSGSFGTATVSGAGSSWNIGGSAVIGASGNNGVGTLSILDQSLVYVGTALSINSFSTVTLNGGTLRFNTVSGLNRLTYTSGTIQLAGGRDVGVDATITTLYGAFPNLPTGKGLTVEGTATLTKPLTITGGAFKTTSLAVGAGGSLNFDHGVLELAGGSLTGLANLVVPANGEFRASGAATTRITAAAGSTITATGDLTLGNAALANGFYSNGDVVMGANTVTLADANDAVLDSAAFVTLGNGGSPGTLAAANGLTLNFGGNITGFGTVDTLNDEAKPFINNGNLIGSSLAEPLTLTGYVKGVGTFDNVEFTGTFAPGFSPAKVNLGSASYNGTLEIEIGGLTPGSSGYDQLNHILGSAIAQLGGTLDVSLLGGFEPEAGNSFTVLTALGGVVGTFADVALPTLVPGLSWNLLYEPNGVLLTVSNAVNGDFDGDGDIDGRDFLAWQRGESPNPFSADDLVAWKTNYGTGPLAASVAVPEPTSSLWPVALFVGIALRRK
ncbi:MAG: hypothetical protein SH868_08820 [Bythopirellula sp.]|nr:hypothetical protein [Bythopirellula sp.]